MDPGGLIHLPIRVEEKENGGINLVPVDFFLRAIMALWEDCPEKGVYHFVNPKPKKIEELIEYTRRLFGISGVRTVPTRNFQKDRNNPLELLFDTYLEAYQPYMSDDRLFDDQKTAPFLQRRQIFCPDLDSDVFARCMNYAVATVWGTKI